MNRPEHPKKKAMRKKLEAKVKNNLSLPKNVTAAHIQEKDLLNKTLTIKGTDHPNMGSLFPLNTCKIFHLRKRVRERTGATHYIEMSTKAAADEHHLEALLKINLSDFPVTILDEKPITYKGKKYLLASLGCPLWASVLLPVSKLLYYTEKA